MNDCLGLKMTDEEVKDLMNEIDTNKNGLIDFGILLLFLLYFLR